jgi:predicted  nucleic acid-binding Zn-ribbon protein
MPELIALNDSLKHMQAEIDDTRAASNRLRDENRAMWAELEARAKETKEQKEEKEQGEEKDKFNASLLPKLRGVFHALILESGVNWAKDADLRAFMLSQRD